MRGPAGLIDEPSESATRTPGIPKLALVAAPKDYVTVAGTPVGAEEYDILGRIMSVQKLHHAYALSGVMCTGAATLMQGTIPQSVSTAPQPEDGSATVRIGHSKGVAQTTRWACTPRAPTSRSAAPA